ARPASRPRPPPMLSLYHDLDKGYAPSMEVLSSVIHASACSSARPSSMLGGLSELWASLMLGLHGLERQYMLSMWLSTASSSSAMAMSLSTPRARAFPLARIGHGYVLTMKVSDGNDRRSWV
ncbi:hypothetical protein Dimus_031657, partial [Dionaea muscipula]